VAKVSRVCVRCDTPFDARPDEARQGRARYCSAECYHLASRRSPRVSVTCVCGVVFEVSANRAATGRGKHCSKACSYANRTRPSGLKYEIKVKNKAWFELGFKQLRGPESPGWRGEDVGYQALHRWVKENRAKPEACEFCGEVSPLDWANKSREYHRDLDDWIALCRLCHRRYDSGPWRGMATMKYGRAGLRGLKAS
jgi:hypothetical protein